MIINKKQFDRFISILYPLEKDECYFVSLSARNKYLSDEEREFYSLGKTEMFGRTIIKDFNDIDFYMKKLYSNLSFKTTNNGKQIPEKALVTYININPSSMIQAYMMFQKEMNRQIYEIMLALDKKKQPNYSYVTRADRVLMNCIQKSKSRRCFVDIDFDVINDKSMTIFTHILNDNGINHYVITSKNGYHVLIELQSLHGKKFNLQHNIEIHHIEAMNSNKGEVKINSNGMVPVPGTRQAGKLVQLL